MVERQPTKRSPTPSPEQPLKVCIAPRLLSQAPESRSFGISGEATILAVASIFALFHSDWALTFIFAFYSPIILLFDPGAHPPPNQQGDDLFRRLLIAGNTATRETHVNLRVLLTSTAINESANLAHEIYNRVFRNVPERLMGK
jgi:hypothetical protein